MITTATIITLLGITAGGGTLGLVLGILQSPAPRIVLKILKAAGDRPLSKDEKKTLEAYNAHRWSTPSDVFGRF